jgi:hypothetical protein
MAQSPQEKHCPEPFSKFSGQMMHAVIPDPADANSPMKRSC